MCSQILNTIGLVSGIIGTILVFGWGLTLQSESYGLGLEDGNIVDTKWGRMTVGESNIKGLLERSHHLMISRIGLGLIAVGFGFQLGAVWTP